MTELSELKVGDVVATASGHGKWTRGIIERITKTQITVQGINYSKKTGRMIGCEEWATGHIYPLEGECLAIVERCEATERDYGRRKKIERAIWGAPEPLLQQIEALLG